MGAGGTLSVFMYPWFAMGHLIPYLHTANKLAERGHKIVLIIPPKAQPVLGPLNLHPDLIQLRPVSVPQVEGLPPNAETTNDVVIPKQQLLLHALDLTEPTIESLLSDSKPDFVFFDLMHWLPGLARRHRIKSVYYSLVSPATIAAFLFATDHHQRSLMSTGRDFPPSINKVMCKHTARVLQYLGMGGGVTVKQRLMTAIFESDAIGFRTCKEIEEPYCQILENNLNKPILLTGPLASKPAQNSLTEDQEDRYKYWADWLGKFKPKEVIFCAFGSEAVLNKDQFRELVLGFELTGLPFIIAVKAPSGVETMEEALPEGFKERIGEKGIVHGGWFPQQMILKHAAVGCFVTHCGYGSVWEGLMSGCQLVALPHAADQCVNAKLMCGVLRVGVEAEIDDEDGSFAKEDVRAAVMAAMADESGIGKEVRCNHDRWREFLMSEGVEDSYFDRFVGNLSSLLE